MLVSIRKWASDIYRLQTSVEHSRSSGAFWILLSYLWFYLWFYLSDSMCWSTDLYPFLEYWFFSPNHLPAHKIHLKCVDFLMVFNDFLNSLQNTKMVGHLCIALEGKPFWNKHLAYIGLIHLYSDLGRTWTLIRMDQITQGIFGRVPSRETSLSRKWETNPGN